MILVDTSAWVEFLRATGSDVHHAVRDLLHVGDAPATTDPVLMELLSGARTEERADELRRFLLGLSHVTVSAPGDYEVAAELYRRCRLAGSTPRALTDCLIAAVALRVDAQVLHRDRDFDVLREHCGLRTVAH